MITERKSGFKLGITEVSEAVKHLYAGFLVFLEYLSFQLTGKLS